MMINRQKLRNPWKAGVEVLALRSSATKRTSSPGKFCCQTPLPGISRDWEWEISMSSLIVFCLDLLIWTACKRYLPWSFPRQKLLAYRTIWHFCLDTPCNGRLLDACPVTDYSQCPVFSIWQENLRLVAWRTLTLHLSLLLIFALPQGYATYLGIQLQASFCPVVRWVNLLSDARRLGWWYFQVCVLTTFELPQMACANLSRKRI